nr:hypothetical protein CFP56_01115 [Quercus suber]
MALRVDTIHACYSSTHHPFQTTRPGQYYSAAMMELHRAAVCKNCWSALRRPSTTAQWHSSVLSQQHRHLQEGHGAFAKSCGGPRILPQTMIFATTSPSLRGPSRCIRRFPQQTARSTATQISRNLDSSHARMHDLVTTVLKPEDRQLPAEQRVLYVFEQFDVLASNLLSSQSLPGSSKSNPQAMARARSKTTATSALLGSVNAVRESPNLTNEILMTQISEHAEVILRNPNVFITPAILKSYIDLQAKLDQPSSFPDIFSLYACKPVPILKGKDISSGVSYVAGSPNKVNAAIESKVANAALTAAIKVNDLPLAIDIIHTSFCAPAFKRSKIIRQALIPISGLAVAPVAAYTLSSSFSIWQDTMSSDYATGLAFAGIMTYVAAVGTMGYITVTTANDQMDRVTWAQGVPLWERWIREEERAAIDRVAGAWGFKDIERRGDEDGEEWQGLKEFVGLNGMVLDRVELMDGME